MIRYLIIASLITILLPGIATAGDGGKNSARDILVTLRDTAASAFSSGIEPPYRKRKRYAIGAIARRQAADIASEYSLLEIDRWPIRSLSVFCIVYRVAADMDQDEIIARLRADSRVDSAQPLQEFHTLSNEPGTYDDTYSGLQRGLTVMDIPAAHGYSRGEGVQIAIVDSRADAGHEDLTGRIRHMRIFADQGDDISRDADHGTAVASIIGATANNTRGIVGIAPDSIMDVYVACWVEAGQRDAICDSFTLAKALDEIIDSSPDILNLSLAGPYDPLLARLLEKIHGAGIVAIAADPQIDGDAYGFPASLDTVISVASGDHRTAAQPIATDNRHGQQAVFAPGDEIMVAVPEDAYDFRSGSSLAAAHVSGVVALLLAARPNIPVEAVRTMLLASEVRYRDQAFSVNACIVLQLAAPDRLCLESGKH